MKTYKIRHKMLSKTPQVTTSKSACAKSYEQLTNETNYTDHNLLSNNPEVATYKKEESMS